MLKPTFSVNGVTREDIPRFFEAFKVHLPLVKCLVGMQDNLVLCAELKKSDSQLLVADVKMYRSEPAAIVEVIWSKHVPVMRDWMLKKHLWFKMDKGEPLILIEYLEAYREDFKVDHEMPIAAFNVTV